MSVIDRGRPQDCSKCYWWFEISCVKREDCFGWETKEESNEVESNEVKTDAEEKKS